MTIHATSTDLVNIALRMKGTPMRPSDLQTKATSAPPCRRADGTFVAHTSNSVDQARVQNQRRPSAPEAGHSSAGIDSTIPTTPQRCAAESEPSTPDTNRSFPKSPLFVHNPYSFTSYDEVQDSSSALPVRSPSFADSDTTEPDLQCSTACSLSTERSTEEDEPHPTKSRRRVSAPCGHDDCVRRLRFKNGLSHYLCTKCSQKWRQ
jgi:hypothetical protein